MYTGYYSDHNEYSHFKLVLTALLLSSNSDMFVLMPSQTRQIHKKYLMSQLSPAVHAGQHPSNQMILSTITSVPK